MILSNNNLQQVAATLEQCKREEILGVAVRADGALVCVVARGIAGSPKRVHPAGTWEKHRVKPTKSKGSK